MNKLNKSSNNIGQKVESKEEERGLLFSNKANVRSSSLDVDAGADYEEWQNLVGVFSILLEVDKRLHPENYKSKRISYESDNSGTSVG